MLSHRERLRDEGGFIHKSVIKFVGGIVKTIVPVIGVAESIVGVGRALFDGADAVPQGNGCPPGFIQTPQGCVSRGATIPMERRGGIAGRFQQRAAEVRPSLTGARPLTGGALDIFASRPSVPRGNGARPEIPRPEIPTLAVTGQFGAGFEASIVSREMRLCPPKTVLGVDGVCYNRRDLRNDERAWPRGRRPLLTGGEMRAVSTASAAAKKLQRKQKQLQELGLLPKPQRTRRALLPGHRATLTHASGGGSE